MKSKKAKDTTILVDSRGHVIVKPSRKDFASDVDYLHAFHAYKDAITREANSGFDEAFRKAMRSK